MTAAFCADSTSTTVGIDLAKSVFQIGAIDAAGNVIVRRQLRRQRMLKFFEQLGLGSLGWRRATLPATGRQLGVGDKLEADGIAIVPALLVFGAFSLSPLQNIFQLLLNFTGERE